MLHAAYDQHCRDLAKASRLATAKAEEKIKADFEKLGPHSFGRKGEVLEAGEGGSHLEVISGSC